MEKHTVSASLTDNTKYMNRALPVKKSFDIIERTLIIGGQNSAFYFIDGFTKDEIMLKLMDSFLNISADDMPEDATSFSTSCIPYVEVDILGDFDSIFKNLLSGVTCLFIDGYEAAIAIDCRTYPSRSIEEPDKDKSLRGSRDGFVETIVFNTALMRRRIRDPHLIMEMYEAGTSTRTDVALCYMSDRVDRELLTTIQNKLEESKSQDLKMSQQSLAEALFQRKWYNPFPKYKFTERPDTACACLMEGKVILLTDTSPSALILPTSIFDMIEEANDYYFPPITGIYLKISRVLITLLTVFMVPLFLLFMQNPAWIPEIFRFVLIEDTVNIPLIFQILILELAIDGLRLAALNTPEHAQHTTQRHRRYRHGGILRRIRLVQQRDHALHGIRLHRQLHPAQLRTRLRIKIHAPPAPHPHRHLQPPRIPHWLPHRRPLRHLQQNPLRP